MSHCHDLHQHQGTQLCIKSLANFQDIIEIRLTNGVVIVFRVIGRGINADLDPSKKTVLDRVAEVDELRDWVERLVCSHDGPHVLVVSRKRLRVLSVRIRRLHLRAQVFGPEQLANVCHRDIPNGDGTIRLDKSVHVRQEMCVGRTAIIVAREDCLEAGHTIVIRQLDATEVGRVQAVSCVVALGRYTAIHSSRIGVPDVNGDGRQGLAGIDINVLNLEKYVHALRVLGLLDIRTHVLANNIVWSVGDLRGEDAACVGAEHIKIRSEHVVVEATSHVVIDRFPVLKIFERSLRFPSS